MSRTSSTELRRLLKLCFAISFFINLFHFSTLIRYFILDLYLWPIGERLSEVTVCADRYLMGRHDLDLDLFAFVFICLAFVPISLCLGKIVLAFLARPEKCRRTSLSQWRRSQKSRSDFGERIFSVRGRLLVDHHGQLLNIAVVVSYNCGISFYGIFTDHPNQKADLEHGGRSVTGLEVQI